MFRATKKKVHYRGHIASWNAYSWNNKVLDRGDVLILGVLKSGSLSYVLR